MKTYKENLGKVSITVEKDGWSNDKDYDKLTIVTYEYKSYISRKPVPARTVLTDKNYWICIGALDEQIVLDFNSFVATWTAKLEQVDADEAARIIAENARKANEIARQQAETQRANTFAGYTASMNQYAINENTRQSNENTRKNNENARVAAEGSVAGHTGRAYAESLRVANESTRQDNETARQNAEGSVQSQTGRAYAESIREQNEITRVANESNRVETEKERNRAEGSLEGTYSVVKATVNNIPSGATQIVSSSSVATGVYPKAELTDFASLPTTLNTSKAYYYGSSAPYTIWTIKFIIAASTKGDSTRWGQYREAEEDRDLTASAAETNRGNSYNTAEGSSSGSVAGDGSRWGTFKTNEVARDQMVEEAIASITGKEDKSNKVTTIGNTPTDTNYPSEKAVKTYVDDIGVYDVSAKNPTAGPNNDGKFTLEYILNQNNVNTLIPTAVRRGGMSIKFVQSSDNKYVQYFLTKNEWTANEADWEKMNLEDEVSQLDADIYGIQEKDFSSQLLTNKSIKVGDYSIGDTVPTTPVFNSGCYCIIIPVYKGNIFKLTGTGGNGPKLWGQLDKNNVLKALYSGSNTVTDLLVTIEYDGYFVVNFVSSGGSVIQMPQEGLIDKVETLETKTEILDSVDDVPTENSNRFVKSSGVFSEYNGLKVTVNGKAQIDYTSSFIPGKAIVLDTYSIGDVVNITPSANGFVRCQVVEVDAGDIFVITGKGGNGPRLWGQLDTDRKLRSVADSNVPDGVYTLTINQNGYLVVNVLTDSSSYGLVKSAVPGLTDRVSDLEQQVSEVPDEISASINESAFQRSLTRGFIAGSGTPNSSSYRLKTNMLPQKEHTISLKSGFMFYSIVLYDSNGDYVYGWEPYSLYTTGKITEPVSRFEYSGEYRIIYSIRRVVEDTTETITTDFDTVVDSLVINDIINKDSAVKISKECGDVDLSLSIIGGSQIDFGNKNVGDAIGNTLYTSYLNCHLVVPCRKGDLFKITAVGDQGNIVAFTDNNRIITYKYNVEDVNRVLSKPFYAPTDGYLYVNSITYNDITKELSLPKCVKFSTNVASYKPVRWAALGDSITISYYSKYATAEDEENDNGTSVSGGFCNTYAYIAASIKNAMQDNYAVGGTGWLRGAELSTPSNSCAIVDRVDFSNYDLVTFAYGINDYKAPSQILGTFSDGAVKDVSVVSCMRYCIEKVIAGNPACKIVVLTPLNARGYNRELGNESTNYAIGAQNSLGYTLQDLYDKIVEVCEYYGIEYIDWTHKSVINRKSIAKLTPDGVHPSKEAQEILGRDLAMKLLF